MADCYCGLATRGNKWKWTTFGVLLVLGFIFLFAGLRQSAACSRSHEIGNCLDAHGNTRRPNGKLPADCQQLKEDEDACLEDNDILISGLVLFWIMSWIGSSVPLYMMCCCTERPNREETLPEGVELGMPHTFVAPAACPAGYPAFPPPAAQPPAHGFLATPTAASSEVGVPMYTATIK